MGGEAAVQAAGVMADGEAVVQTADVTAEGEAVVQKADVTGRQRSRVARMADSLFPYILVDEQSSMREMAKQIYDAFRSNKFGIVDLVLANKESRGKLLLLLAGLPADWGAWATVAPRRKDNRMRLRIALGQHAAKEAARTTRVSSHTEVENLGGFIIGKLIELEREQRSGAGAGGGGGLQLQIVGANATAIATLAIENARFRSKRELRIMASRNDKEDGKTVLTVTVVPGNSATAPGIAQRGGVTEDEMEVAADPVSADTARAELDWSPPKFASLLQTFLLTNRSSSRGLAKAVAEVFESHTTRIVQLKAFGGVNGMPAVMSLVANMPGFFDVAAQLGPDDQYLLIKSYPSLLPPEVKTSRVAASTDPQNLSIFIRNEIQSLEENGHNGAVRFEVTGDGASKALLQSFQFFQAETKRDLSFKVAWTAHDNGASGYEVTAFAP